MESQKGNGAIPFTEEVTELTEELTEIISLKLISLKLSNSNQKNNTAKVFELYKIVVLTSYQLY